MTGMQKFRTVVDVAMLLLTIVLMGGNFFFPSDAVHEYLGVALFLVWAVHVFLNRKWYGAIPKGRYNLVRGLQTFVNICITVSVIVLAVSGAILSSYVPGLKSIESGMSFARTGHLLASHWYYVFLSMHLGLHVTAIVNRFGKNMAGNSANDNSGVSQNKSGRDRGVFNTIAKVFFALVSGYGIYAFIERKIPLYLVLKQEFFFFDMDRGYVLFFVDYIAVIILFATLTFWLSKLFKIFKAH